MSSEFASDVQSVKHCERKMENGISKSRLDKNIIFQLREYIDEELMRLVELKGQGVESWKKRS